MLLGRGSRLFATYRWAGIAQVATACPLIAYCGGAVDTSHGPPNGSGDIAIRKVGVIDDGAIEDTTCILHAECGAES